MKGEAPDDRRAQGNPSQLQLLTSAIDDGVRLRQGKMSWGEMMGYVCSKQATASKCAAPSRRHVIVPPQLDRLEKALTTLERTSSHLGELMHSDECICCDDDL